jgi:CBS-domain-containing membrane protein
MASSGFTRMPVLDRRGKLAGMVSLQDLLSARARNLSEERDRERVIRIRVPFGFRASEKES